MFCGLAALAEEKDNIPVLFMRGLLTRQSAQIPVYFFFCYPSPFLPNFLSNIHFLSLFIHLERLI